MLREIFLHGALGREFGRRFSIDVDTPNEAVRALIMLRPGLREKMRQGWWRVIVGPPRLRYAVDTPFMQLGSQPLHFVPATPPRGDDTSMAIGKIVVGTILIGSAIALAPWGAGLAASVGLGAEGIMGISYGSIALLGASMVFAGVASLLSRPSVPQAQANPLDGGQEEDRPSFIFSGAVNNVQQGGPVPLIFGTHLVGSVVLSAGITIEDI